ncbi:GIY-YIG nuclease family protein [Nonomuraea roseoviolacea]|uniref:GIY-YIG nuclease family protein n=1 Tax=Nonomuraea roseoviolacea TaxID=103837 RepID=UPI003B5B6841
MTGPESVVTPHRAPLTPYHCLTSCLLISSEKVAPELVEIDSRLKVRDSKCRRRQSGIRIRVEPNICQKKITQPLIGLVVREASAERAGFVYILINPSFPDMVKIGLTRNLSGNRASQLSRHSGVPTDFIVIYDELVADCGAVERRLHKRFANQRVNDRREFFLGYTEGSNRCIARGGSQLSVHTERKSGSYRHSDAA